MRKKQTAEIEYLKSGFSRIQAELDMLELKIGIIIGLVFKRHQYSVDALLNSEHLRKVESYVRKIGDDISRWEQTGKLSFGVRRVYNQSAEAVHERIHALNERIQQRVPTFWEKVCDVFIRFCEVVIEQLPFIGFRLLLALKRRKFFGKPI
jgi:hypothetical protein